MSQENVDNLRRGFEAYARGDLDEALANLEPDVVYKPAQEAAVRGRDAVRASLERWEADWDELEMTSEEIIDAGYDLEPPSFADAVGAAGRGRRPVLPGPHRQRRQDGALGGVLRPIRGPRSRRPLGEAMSQENVEIVRRLVEGGHEEVIGQGDYSPLLESIDPEIEVEALRLGGDLDGIYRGFPRLLRADAGGVLGGIRGRPHRDRGVLSRRRSLLVLGVRFYGRGGSSGPSRSIGPRGTCGRCAKEGRALATGLERGCRGLRSRWPVGVSDVAGETWRS